MSDQISSLVRVFGKTKKNSDATLSIVLRFSKKLIPKIVYALELRFTGTQIMIGTTVKNAA